MLTPTGLTQHEILTIARKFTTSGITAKNLESVKAVVQEALRKKVNIRMKKAEFRYFLEIRRFQRHETKIWLRRLFWNWRTF